MGSGVGARPRCLVVVTGTDTDVGKTWVSCKLLTSLRKRGVSVSARKPVQSFLPSAGPTDAELLASASGDPPGDVCPADHSYELPLAPPMAAEALGRTTPTIAEIGDSIRWPSGVDLGLVEAVGGPRSPLGRDGDTVDLARSLTPDLVVLVAPAGLGTINASRLSAAVFEPIHVTIVLNRFERSSELHRANLTWLAERCGLDVVADPDELAERLAG